MREDELTIHMMSEEQLGTVTEGEDTADRMSVNFPGGTLEERNGFARPLLSSTFISGPTAYDTVEMISVGEEKVEIEMERGEKPIAMGDREQFEEDSLVPGGGYEGGNGHIQPLLSSHISFSPNTTELLAAEALINEAREIDRLLNQFKKIRDLCNNDIDTNFKIFQEDETDLMKDVSVPCTVRIPRYILSSNYKFLDDKGIWSNSH